MEVAARPEGPAVDVRAEEPEAVAVVEAIVAPGAEAVAMTTTPRYMFKPVEEQGTAEANRTIFVREQL